MSKPSIKQSGDLIGIIAGVVIFSAFLILSWVPQPCPILSRALSVCPKGNYMPPAPLTPAQKELARIPHQRIKSDEVDFTAPSQNFRATTKIDFEFYGDPSQTMVLEVQTKNGLQQVSIINHPYLAGLNWSQVNEEPYHLYQQDPTFTSITAFSSHLPSSNLIAADAVSAAHFNLPSGSYILFDPNWTLEQAQQQLKGIQYFLTTYSQIPRDGTWYAYSQTNFDLTNALPDAKNTLDFTMLLPNNHLSKTPFYLSTVHIDYMKMAP
jgi:hypothetical protein